MSEVSQDFVKALKYVGGELEERQKDYSDDFVSCLQKSVKKVKFDRKMGRLEVEHYKEKHYFGYIEGIGNLFSYCFSFSL